MRAIKLTCPGCGASLDKPEEQTFQCSYCHSTVTVEGFESGPSFLVKAQVDSRLREPLPALSLTEFPSSSFRKSPRGVVTMLFRALLFLSEDWDKTLIALSSVLAKPTLEEHETTRLLRIFQSTPHVILSYLGGTPENGYYCSPPVEPQIVEEACEELSKDEAKIYVQSSGRKYASKILLRKNKDNQWKVFEWSDLGIGVKPPIKVDDDF